MALAQTAKVHVHTQPRQLPSHFWTQPKTVVDHAMLSHGALHSNQAGFAHPTLGGEGRRGTPLNNDFIKQVSYSSDRHTVTRATPVIRGPMPYSLALRTAQATGRVKHTDEKAWPDPKFKLDSSCPTNDNNHVATKEAKHTDQLNDVQRTEGGELLEQDEFVFVSSHINSSIVAKVQALRNALLTGSSPFLSSRLSAEPCSSYSCTQRMMQRSSERPRALHTTDRYYPTCYNPSHLFYVKPRKEY